jgi:hypothetical protein
MVGAFCGKMVGRKATAATLIAVRAQNTITRVMARKGGVALPGASVLGSGLSRSAGSSSPRDTGAVSESGTAVDCCASNTWASTWASKRYPRPETTLTRRLSSSPSAARISRMHWNRLSSPTCTFGQTACINCSLLTTRPAFASNTPSKAKGLGRSRTASPPGARSSARCSSNSKPANRITTPCRRFARKKH